MFRVHSFYAAVPPNCVQYGTSGVVGVTTHLIKVVHEHLPHLVDRYGCIHRALQSQFPHQVWEETQVGNIWVGQ